MILTRKWYSFRKNWISFLLSHLIPLICSLLISFTFSSLWFFVLSLQFFFNNTLESIYNLMMILKLQYFIIFLRSCVLAWLSGLSIVHVCYFWMIFHLSISGIRLSIKLIKSYFHHWLVIIDWSDHHHYQDIISTILERISSVDILYRRDWNHSFDIFFFFFSCVIRRRRLLSSSYIISLWRGQLFLTILFLLIILRIYHNVNYEDIKSYIRINHKGMMINILYSYLDSVLTSW